ncbi:hypothetical protein DR864_11255 [Runella rosea]|uniref:histidine kinase n=1 Tax=Runella rosea TaxID=2259595 RepID=A0A344TI10_9BACT|nr:histidine kinase [Runella rosea]AXE18281.1 hypothetical protein DR864_11255 [Runella rosea]
MKHFFTLIACSIWIGHAFAQNIQFTSFTATNEFQDSSYNIHKPIALNFRETHILASFKDATDSLNAKYAYCLKGLDGKWHPNGKGESVNYVNLFGGDYELQVKNLNYPNKIISLKFHLEEAFWQKNWFIPMLAAYGLLVVGVIFYFIRMYRLRGQIRLQQVRNEIASDLHDDVGSTLSNISFLGEMAKMKLVKKPEEVLPILERIMEESKEMVQTMRGMVWTIQPDNDRAVDFIDKIQAFATEMLQNREIALQFSNEIPEKQLLTIEQQRNLFLIFKELIHNIAKHSTATRVTVSLKKHEHWLWAKITDNGSGFDMTQRSEGNGLRNLQQRITQLEGKMEIESEVGKGTVTKMMIPL